MFFVERNCRSVKLFAVGAGAVTKLVDNTDGINDSDKKIVRLFNQKYPYEYLSEDKSEEFYRSAISFYKEHNMI